MGSSDPKYVLARSVPQRYYFEYEEIADRDDLDWQQLYFEAQELLETSHGLRNRRRIMKILKGTNALFLKFLSDD